VLRKGGLSLLAPGDLEAIASESLEYALDAASGSVISIGVDAVEIESFKRDLELAGDRFLERIYTEQERAYCNGRVEQLATRFAAKEAAAKALGTGIRGVDWRDLEVRSEPNGQPRIVLRGQASREAGARRIGAIVISLCHTREHAIAVAVAVAASEKGEEING
jgi:holo-[acyl-carrier protein] synthase